MLRAAAARQAPVGRAMHNDLPFDRTVSVPFCEVIIQWQKV
jgi:hypothetical protein